MTEFNDFPEVMTKPAFGYKMTKNKTTTFAGGKPFINDVFEFPKDKEGNPLRFFCQIDLSNVDKRVIETLYLPASGFLQFYHGNEDVFGMDFDNDDFSDNDSRILYFEEAFDEESLEMPDYGEDAEDTTPLDDAGLSRIYYTGEYVELLPFPNSIDNPAIGEIDKNGEDYYDYYEFANEENHELYLGGYPHFTQWDFRANRESDLSLLLGSESGSNIIWGDVGAGGFWIPERNLRKQDYSNSVIFWDCM